MKKATNASAKKSVMKDHTWSYMKHPEMNKVRPPVSRGGGHMGEWMADGRLCTLDFEMIFDQCLLTIYSTPLVPGL